MEPLLKYAIIVSCMAGLGSGVRMNGARMKNCCCGGNSGDYSDCNLPAVPKGLAATTTVLDLSHNEISAIRRGDFSGTPKLEVLILAFNRIRTIEAGALRDVPLVRYLDLYQNDLSAIPEQALVDLPNLQNLNISMNNYTSFALGEAFSKMSNLQSLTMGTAHTSELNASDLQALSNISLNYLCLNTGSPLIHYEPGALANLTLLEKLSTNFSIDDELSILSKMFIDLQRTRMSGITIQNILINQIYNKSVDLFLGMSLCPLLKNITLIGANFTNADIISLLLNVYLSKVTSVTLTNSSYTDYDTVFFPNMSHILNKAALEIVIIDGIFHKPMTYPLFFIPFSLFPNFSKFKISNTGLNKVDCFLLTFPGEILDFSNNLLEEDGMWLPKCPQNDILLNTTHLIISHNRFSDLYTIAQKVVVMPNILSLDLSYNSITYIDKCSRWPQTLQTLILRNNDISKDSKICISEYLQELDLSYTRLETFSQTILNDGKSLQVLYLTGNNIKYIAPELYSSSLQVLYMDRNGVGIISEDTFKGFENIKTLYLGNNPYYCFCDLYWFQQKFDKQLLGHWPRDYMCSYPNDLSNSTLDDFNLSIVTCDKRIIISLSVGITAFIIILTLCLGYYFDAVWYIRMGMVWISAQGRKNKSNRGTFKYHAFISYSQLDSDWVENTLVPTLESSDPDLKLCIHERDFTPGEWIVDNIIQCIEHSNKTLFILSRNFVNSEWCHYELYFAQHRVLEQRQDSLVLLLLEPLPRNSVPNKFCRLRKLLNRKTYLEWPAEEHKKTMFWASLRAVLQSDHQSDNQNSNDKSISKRSSNTIVNPYG